MSRLIDWKSVCLVCLKKGENRSIFDRDTDSNVIADKIIKSGDIFIEKNTDQPKSICLQCLDNLNVTYKFHRNYEQSDSIIKVVLSTNHQEFPIKDLWKTAPFRGAQQKESPQKEILHIEESANSDEINIKHEIIENYVVDDTHDRDTSPTIDLGDDIDTEAKVVKHPAEACLQGTAIEQNDVKANNGNKICKICNRAYKHLKFHMRHHSNERPFRCDDCDKAYFNSRDLRRHMKVHTGKKSYECQYCDRRFTENRSRKHHERTHTGEKPYECQYCDHRFAVTSSRKTHERTHTGEKPFVCPTCGKSFAHSGNLSQHLRSHTGVKKFICEECGKRFCRREYLKSHVRRHLSRDKFYKSSEHKQKKVLEKEIFQIEECAKSNEIIIKHEIIENDVVDDTHDNDNSPCINLKDNIDTTAKLGLKDPTEASFHGSAIELNDVKAIKTDKICGICNRAYRQLDIHMRRHNNKRPFSADRCDKSFATSWKLRQHMTVHTGEKPYECQYCNRHFTQNSHRKTHERIHTGEKAYECQYCDRRFAEKSHKKSHERMHTGERPFLCPTCGKSFAYSHVLSNHRRIHTGIKKFMCEECGKGFNRKESLEWHVRRHLSRDKLDKSSEHKQKKLLEKEIFQIEECAKSTEIIESDVVDNTHDNDTSSCIDLEDSVDTAAKLVQKDPIEACLQGSAMELNDVKSYESNKPKQDANDKISRQLRNESKAPIENTCDKQSRKTVYNKAPKICEICNRGFKYQARLTIHMRHHNNERPFSCDRCDKAFVTSWKLRRHLKVHTAEKHYECQYCDRRFAEKSQRKNHERTHTGERPFVCPTCGKSFAYSHVLSNHRRIHTGIKKFMCKECGRGFNRKDSLERHVRRHMSRDKLDKSSEHKQKKVLEMEIL